MRSLLAPLVLVLAAAAQPRLPSPREALGHEVGADRFLASYTQLVDWWRQLDAASDRMILREIGTTGYGQTMVMAVISAPENLARIERLREVSATLAKGRAPDGKPLDDEQIAALAEQGRAVVWIDAGLHATEAIAGQNVLELVWRMVSGDSAEIRRILDEVVLLACPVNPDGMEMVARAYMASGRVGNLPVLYQRYCGHDNNRDHYAVNTAETLAVTRVFYHEWFPQIVYNHHQTAPRGTVIYTPPFRDPYNYYVDPLVVRGIEFIAANMNARFAWEGKAGVISRTGAPYSMWWNGGLRTTTCFHNMIGILTEAFGHPEPTELRQGIDRRLGNGDYPMPVATRMWHARDTIEYLQTANFAILDTAARYRTRLLTNFGRMAVASIERGSRDHWTPTPRLLALAQAAARDARRPAAADERSVTAANDGGDAPRRVGRGRVRDADAAAEAVFSDPELRDPRAYVLPVDQPDRGALRRFLIALRRTGVDVHRATEEFTAAGQIFPPGTFVVRCDQAFRPHVLDMFEPQWHPDDIGPDGEPIRPYDSAGWTFALQTGVRFTRVLDALEGSFVPVGEIELPPVAPAGTALPASDSDAFLAVNRLLRAGAVVRRARDAFVVERTPGAAGERAEAIAAELRLPLLPTPGPVSERRLRPLRIGVFDVWGGNMETGWTQWVLDQFEFPHEPVFGDAVEAGDLRARFDVLLFATGLPSTSPAGDAQSRPRAAGASDAAPTASAATAELADKVLAAMPPFEDWSKQRGRIVRISRERGVANLRAFVEQGGTLLVFANQAQRAARHFDLPVTVGLYRGEGSERRALGARDFFIPGSLVALHVDRSHPLAAGMPERIAGVFRRSEAIIPAADAGDRARVVASYGERAELLSGWALGIEHLDGKGAVVECPVGAGRVILYGADVIYRGQPIASFKLVFHALYGEE
ncbi:MAG TPA: M14 metallopeptidase family protein [Planctomycetota bacterium]|nr:M14 metallopeptidase family protein [Planctomycetota bacterium]